MLMIPQGCALLALGLATLLVPALSVADPVPLFTEDQVLGGVDVAATTLNAGRDAYGKYCASCHGENGDGRGRSSKGLRVPPRDFRIATYKFAGALSDDLPRDEDLGRILDHGLSGTAMLRWDVPPKEMNAVLQYIKTFSPDGEGWRDPYMEAGEDIIDVEDPYSGAEKAQGVDRGRILYHGLARCYQCHPSYKTRAEINRDLEANGQAPVTGFRPNLWLSVPTKTNVYSVPVPGNPDCRDNAVCSDEHVCRFGVCEAPGWLMPPDFTINQVRSGNTPESLFRIIAAGIPGTAMPQWKYSFPDEDIWALAHYVSSLIEKRNTPEMFSLKEKLRGDQEPLDQSTPASTVD